MSVAELSALRLDGQLVDVDDVFVALDEPVSAELRASALARGAPELCIAERSSALWVWGARSTPPVPHEFSVPAAAGQRPLGSPRFSIRMIVYRPGDVVELGGMRVTSPARTIVDIARQSSGYDLHVERQLNRLVELCGLDGEVCRELVRRGSPAANQGLAERRLATLFARQPPLTR